MELLGVGAPEALVILVITLIVVGPNRFPEIARQGGRWYRMARRYAAEVTADVRGAVEELGAEVEAQKDELTTIHKEISGGITSSIDETQEELRDVGRDTQAALSDDPPAGDNGAARLLAPRELPAGGGEDAAAPPEPRTEDG